MSRVMAEADEPTLTVGAAQASGAAGAEVKKPDRALPQAAPGRYRLGAERGRGGLGRVSEATDQHLDRTVAVKELLHVGGAARARFAREARITARLQHPAIVPIYDAGEWPGGEPFYAMKLVDGRPLAELVAGAGLEARLALVPRVLAVAEAVAFAHSRGVIHRDLKPQNVLVGEFGEVVVIDWGLARDLGEPDDLPPGAIAGTPAYMAPEQARGESADRRADVYALGAILYHVLAGSAPRQGDANTVLAQVRQGPPPPLSTRAPGTPRDLLAIVAKALAHEPAARYDSARAFADDLSRFLTGQLVGAREYRRVTLLLRWLRRHRAAVAVAALLLTVLAITATVAVRRVLAERNVARARSAELTLAQARTVIDRDPTRALAWLAHYPSWGTEWDRVQEVAADAQSRGPARHALNHDSEAVLDVRFVAGANMIVTAAGDRVRFWSGSNGALRSETRLHEVWRLAVAPGGGLVAAGTMSGEVVLVAANEPLPRPVTRYRARVTAIAFSPDGTRLLSTASSGELRITNLADGSTRGISGHAGMITQASWAGSSRVASLSLDRTVRLWDADGLVEIGRLAVPSPGQALAASVSGQRIAFGDNDQVMLWPVGADSATPLGTHVGAVIALAFSPEGDELASGGEDGVVVRYDLAGLPGEARRLRGHDAMVRTLSFGSDGLLVSGDIRGEVRLWRGDEALERQGHDRAVTRIAIDDQQGLLATASEDGSVRLWPIPPPRDLHKVSSMGLYRVRFAPDGALIAAGRDRLVYRRAAGSSDWSVLGSHGLDVYGIEFLADGTVATSAWDGTIRLWGARAPDATLRQEGEIGPLVVSPDRRILFSANDRGVVMAWDAEARARGTGRVVTRHGTEVTALAVAPSGSRLASGSADGELRIVDLAGGATTDLPRSAARPSELAFSPDGKTVYAAFWDGTARAFDLAGGGEQLLVTQPKRLRAMALSPDGRWLAVGGLSRVVSIVDLRHGTIREARGPEDQVRNLIFSPDGSILAAASWDRTVRLWRLGDGAHVVLRGHGASVQRVAFSPDGQWLASTGDDGLVGRWRLAALEWMPAPRASR
jgi:WD40 repeat protein